MTREPLITIATITSAVTAVLYLLTEFGLSINNNQQAAIIGVVAVVAPFLVAFATRPKVTPVASPHPPAGA